MDHVADRQRAAVALDRLDHQVTLGRHVDRGALDVVGAEVDPHPAAEGRRPGAPVRHDLLDAADHRIGVANLQLAEERHEQVDPVDLGAEPVQRRGEAGDLGQRRLDTGVAVAGSSAITGHDTFTPTPTTTTARSWAAGAR